MANEPFRIFIGKHPCDDLPYIVGLDPDPRSPDFDPFRGIEGEDYSGWYVLEVEPCVHGNYAPHIIMHRSTLMCDGKAKQRKATKETT